MKHNRWLFMLSPYFGQSELKVLLSHNPRGEAVVRACMCVCVTETFIIFKVTLESFLLQPGGSLVQNYAKTIVHFSV